MAKTLISYVTLKPGPEQAGAATRLLKLAPGEAQDAGFPACTPANLLETIDHGSIGSGSGGPAATSGMFVATFDNSGMGANGADGYTLTTGTTSGNKNNVKHLRRVSAAGAVGKEVTAAYTASFGTVTTQSGYLGFWNNQADPAGTAPTNGAFFVVTNAALILRVRGNAGTAADSATLATLAGGASVRLSLHFLNTGSAATSWGYVTVDGVRTNFTAAQVAQLAAMTGDLFHWYHVQTGAAAARTLTIERSWVCSDL